MRWTWLPLLLTACDPLGPFERVKGPPDPDYSGLVVYPNALDFGGVSALDADGASLTFTVTNVNDEALPIYSYDAVEGQEPGIFTVAADEPFFQLEPGESRDLTVAFTPRTADLYAGQIRLNGGVETVSVEGVGTAPVIALADDAPAAASLGCSAEFKVWIENVGDEPLELADDALSVADSDEFSLLRAPGTVTLEPGQMTTVDVLFEPRYDPDANPAESREGWLVARSNDPATPEARHPLSVQVIEGQPQSQEFTYYPERRVDLLLAVDTGGVMDGHLQKAEEALYTLADAFMGINADLNAAIVTGGGACPATAAPFLAGDFTEAQLVAHLQSGLSGPAGAGSGRLLAHAADALSQDAPGGCLEGFLREDALLHVLVIAGGDDQSGQDADEQLTQLRLQSPLADEHIVSAVVATDPGGCQGASYGALYIDAAFLTGGEVGDLCAAAWDDPFARVARISALQSAGSVAYALDPAPVLETIAVEVDGVTFTNWTYDESDGALVFPAEGSPAAGSAVLVSYLEAIACF